jgi:hypothetical protein
MPTVFVIKENVSGEDYSFLLDSALGHFDSFTLQWPAQQLSARELHPVGQELRRHEIDTEKDLVLYRLDREALAPLLKPGSLFGWKSPDYPENPAFYRTHRTGFTVTSSPGTVPLACVLDQEFARLLSPRIRLVEESVPESFLRKVV